MKKLLLALTMIFCFLSLNRSYSLADVFCPASIDCFQNNNFGSCVINESDGHWTFDNVPPSFWAGNFLFSGAIYEKATKKIKCRYIPNSVKNHSEINLIPSDFIGTPDATYGNGNFCSSFWTKNGNLMTCYIEGRLNCPVVK